ncbi:MAG: type VI secretion system baseplate subunit TssG [Pseudomonadota bacterium]
MSSSQRRTHAGVISQLLAQPHQFEFFQSVRMLERWLATPERGDLLPPQIRFCNSTSLSFPASEIESLRMIRHELAVDVTDLEPTRAGSGADGAQAPVLKQVAQATDDLQSRAALALHQSNDASTVARIEIVPAVMGLLGVTGALPTVYTDLIAQRELYQRDFAARRFLDLFSHRAVSLFYAAWKKSRMHLQYEQNRQKQFVPMVLSLAGVGQASLRERLGPAKGGVNDESLAFFAGALQQRVRSARQLAQLLSAYLKVPVTVEQFAGRWYGLPKEAQTSLGMLNGVLGQNALAGERVWQRDLRVKLMLGPLDPHRFRRFLPGCEGAFALKKMLGLLNGTSLEFEVNLVLQAAAVQGTVLASDRSPTMGRLGWDTYLLTGPNDQDRCDVRYDIQSADVH